MLIPVFFARCESSPLLLVGGEHALEVGRPLAAALRLQRPMSHGGKEEGGERRAVLLALRALRGLPLSGRAVGCAFLLRGISCS